MSIHSYCTSIQFLTLIWVWVQNKPRPHSPQPPSPAHVGKHTSISAPAEKQVYPGASSQQDIPETLLYVLVTHTHTDNYPKMCILGGCWQSLYEIGCKEVNCVAQPLCDCLWLQTKSCALFDATVSILLPIFPSFADVIYRSDNLIPTKAILRRLLISTPLVTDFIYQHSANANILRGCQGVANQSLGLRD